MELAEELELLVGAIVLQILICLFLLLVVVRVGFFSPRGNPLACIFYKVTYILQYVLAEQLRLIGERCNILAD